ncbi:ABC-transporter permease [Vibrio mimicus SX-4]|uniref:Transport permease protein n=2 Tax=Vibrio mimicus TaxID=674 RepID=A0A2J9V076_VIBMI|nr:O-antigen export system permease protein rfbA [Vibrio mimicus VM573]EGU18503.1 ABC-transporter permease [Vibrio mimicus SX-4]KFE30229.1 ABC-2 type transporter family protein [Vibrio mimicus]PNM57155.1 ABC transporter permease [Vibrio mimicus]BCN22311.1 putative O-antigen ABC transporter permease [Vibrio mimicus]
MNVMKEFLDNKTLLKQLMIRDFTSRYKSGALGLAWAMINPLLMLGLYSFVFVAVFKMRWGVNDTSGHNFVLLLFTGILVHGLFSEFVVRAPNLITSNPSYVKKVVFPLELIPLTPILGAIVNFCLGLTLVLIMQFWINEEFSLYVLLIPIIILPFIILLIGVSYIFSSLGVYFRDLSQISGLISTIAIFASPVLFPMENVPDAYRNLLYLNPITLVVEQLREVIVLGQLPNLVNLTIYSGISIAILIVGIFWFKIVKKGFSDVL